MADEFIRYEFLEAVPIRIVSDMMVSGLMDDKTDLQTGLERDSRVDGLDLHFAQGLGEEEVASVEGGGAAIVVRALGECDFWTSKPG
jgi:hypothetical protein